MACQFFRLPIKRYLVDTKEKERRDLLLIRVEAEAVYIPTPQIYLSYIHKVMTVLIG